MRGERQYKQGEGYRSGTINLGGSFRDVGGHHDLTILTVPVAVQQREMQYRVIWQEAGLLTGRQARINYILAGVLKAMRGWGCAVVSNTCTAGQAGWDSQHTLR